MKWLTAVVVRRLDLVVGAATVLALGALDVLDPTVVARALEALRQFGW